jgi:Fe-S-cluster containining protein
MTSMETLRGLFAQYRQLLNDADDWFDQAATGLGPTIGCQAGCSACCRGLFDITLPDALLLQVGFSQIDEERRQHILERCRLRRDQLQELWPELAAPYLLNALHNRPWQTMPEQDTTPCPLLDEQGYCSVYPYRPLTCRLHGFPHIETDGEVFSDSCCPYNEEAVCRSAQGVAPGPFRDLFTREAQLIRQVNLALTGVAASELDTFIPLALLIDFSDPQRWQFPADIRALC